MKTTKHSHNQSERKKIERIHHRANKGKTRCACGGKCSVHLELIRGGRLGITRLHVRFHCSREKCSITTEWHGYRYIVTAWEKWKKLQRIKRRKNKRHKA